MKLQLLIAALSAALLAACTQDATPQGTGAAEDRPAAEAKSEVATMQETQTKEEDNKDEPSKEEGAAKRD